MADWDSSLKIQKIIAGLAIIKLILLFGLVLLCFLQFIETGPELGNNYTEVIAPQDVAVYGGLCALASFDRTELKVSSCSPPTFTGNLHSYIF